MLQLVKRYGHNFGILDTDDFAFDWVSYDDLKGYVSQGVEIAGVSKDMKNINPQIATLTPEQCNFVHGKNVFAEARGFIISKKNGKFTINADRRRYKGVLSKGMNNRGLISFNCGVQVRIGLADYDVLMSDDYQKVMALLNSLGNGLTPNKA